MKTRVRSQIGEATRRTLNGRRVVVLDEREYEHLRDKADEWEPSMPAPNSDGTYPAAEALRVSLARNILRHRRRLGLTQVDLARRAGIKVETLKCIEHGLRTPAVATVDKIERALVKAEKGKGQ